MKQKALKKPMDKDNSFRAVELVVPKEEIKRDSNLVKELANPVWKTAAFNFEDGKCQKKEFASEDEAVQAYREMKGHKMLVQNGGIRKQEGEDQNILG